MVAQATAHPAARLLRTLADPMRFRLLRELPLEPSDQLQVGGLARRLGVTDAVISQHLRVLSSVGIVGVRRQGRTASYFVRPEALAAARQTLAGAWPSLFAPTAHESQLSARNQLVGSVVEIKRGEITSEVALAVGDQVITGVITNASVDRLGLEPGSVATAVIKSTDVMFLK